MFCVADADDADDNRREWRGKDEDGVDSNGWYLIFSHSIATAASAMPSREKVHTGLHPNRRSQDVNQSRNTGMRTILP